MSLPDKDDDIISSINVTPLVDITLVLLIVFMVTAKFIVSRSMTLDLPQAASAKTVQLIFAVEVKRDGETWLNGRKVTDDRTLLDQARRSLRDGQQVRAVIQADRRVPHGRVVRVLDLLRQAGISKVAFSVTPLPPESERREASRRGGRDDGTNADDRRLAQRSAR